MNQKTTQQIKKEWYLRNNAIRKRSGRSPAGTKVFMVAPAPGCKLVHKVIFTGHGVRCDCQYYQRFGRPCSHIKACVEHVGR